MKKNLCPMFILCIVAAGFLMLASCAPKSGSEGRAATKGEAVSASSAEVGSMAERYPHEALTMEQGKAMKASPTGYGGSVNFQRVELVREIAVNFQGSAFAKDYAEDRSHVYAWSDLLTSKRISASTPGACLSCKTSSVASIFAEQGWAYASRPLSDFTGREHPGIDCLYCHDPQSGALRPIQPGFIEAAPKAGIKLAEATQRQMQTYVCAQCHSEYYFEPKTTRVVFPWDKGLGASAAWQYYESKPAGFDGDYTHTLSGTRLLKAQHPDFEEFAGGVHGQANVTCADCHLPAIQIDGKTVRSHQITSPLHTIEASCMTCHKGKTEEWLLAQVKTRQDAVYAAQTRAGQAIAEAHQAVANLAARKPDSEELVKARALLRMAQWFWDYTASANSMGFHNPVGAMENLSIALEAAKNATLLALK